VRVRIPDLWGFDVTPSSDSTIDSRMRRLEDAFIRFDERCKVYDLLAPKVQELEKAVSSIWATIGQMKVKAGVVWAIVGTVGGIAAAVTTHLLMKAL
jgi:hypothetical protein